MEMYFEGFKKNFGFGFMRLPMQGGEVDFEETSRMVDAFMEAGFSYFDTAHGYLGGKSEQAVRECLVKRYPRESYTLTNKLSDNFFHSREDIRPCLESQLAACGVEFFDVYLMHALNRNNYRQYVECDAFAVAQELKREGKVRHVGFSFHDTAEMLERILTERPELEVVQLQFNYLDYEDAKVQSRRCYEVCRKHKKPVIVMEPVKGGSLVNLPEEAQQVYEELGSPSSASYAIRFAAGFPGIVMVLSGMGSMAQMEDNISFMKDFVPLSKREQEAVARVRRILLQEELIPCTACHYCTDGCPVRIPIPELFDCMNRRQRMEAVDVEEMYRKHSAGRGKAGDCIRCGKCEGSCPQHLEIRRLLERVAASFE